MTMLPRWVSRAAAHPPPGPFQATFWRSPLRGPWFTTMLSVALLPGITLIVSNRSGVLRRLRPQPGTRQRHHT
jgi:hypothetical protein